MYEGCERVTAWKGLCERHYRQNLRGEAGSIRKYRAGSAVDRDDLGRKLCIHGNHWVAVDQFQINRNAADGLFSYCRDCNKLRLFNMTLADYEKKLAEQNYGCAVCGGLNLNGKALTVDHDHKCCSGRGSCGKCVRGLLCANCNTGVGMMADSPQRLRDAADYLEKY